jgi:hypothetical protein
MYYATLWLAGRNGIEGGFQDPEIAMAHDAVESLLRS